MITSDKNAIIKEIIKLKMKKERDKMGLFYIEGERFIDEIPENITVEKFIISEKFSTKIADSNKYSYAENIFVADDVFKKISDTSNPQGIMAICKKMDNVLEDAILEENNFFVILDRIADPGNLGTIIRTAEALGSSGIILSESCVDLYNPKVLRATMGSIFHIPIFDECNIDNILEKFKNNNIKIICTHLDGDKAPYDIDLKTNIAILIGNEANGVLEEYKEKSDILVKIPMAGKVESINASTSASIMLYEVLRQRLS